MNIVTAFSPNWSNWVAILMYSVFKNHSKPITMYLLTDTLSDVEIAMFDKVVRHFGNNHKYVYIDASAAYEKLIPSGINVDNRFSKYTLYRLMMPQLLPKSLDRLLYIDADTIVDSDLEKLYTIDMGNNLIMGVPDNGVKNLKLQSGFDKDDWYINAGVILMNYKQLMTEGIATEWAKLANDQHFLLHDQDILNYTCRNRVGICPLPYNVSVSTGTELGSYQPYIMHYAGDKPFDNDKCFRYDIWSKYEKEYRLIETPIPKIIHYCWFGGQQKPAKIMDCINSWKTILPEYEIIEWNESNFDISLSPYAKAAYDAKKYAFVTDYVRLWALFNYGGIYMDSDVQVVKPLDQFLYHGAFTGHETAEKMGTATMGSRRGHPWIKMLLDYYETQEFDIKNMRPNTDVITELSRPIIKSSKDNYVILENDVHIYPVEYFCSFDHVNLKVIPTDKAYTHHLFFGSWLGRSI
jgi:lipopolysaccharide biosynthesis glycosyltransferase